MSENFKDMFEETSNEDWGKWRKEKQKRGGKRIAEASVEEFAERIKGLECIQDIWNIKLLIERIVVRREREFAELEAYLDYDSGHTLTDSVGTDAVLFTGVGWSANRGEWKNMKGDMKKCCLMLARIPTDIQEGFTSSHSTIGFALSKSPYMIPHLEEIWAAQTSRPEQSFASVIEKMMDRGGAFDQCPALIDGTLSKSFDALFHIYGDIFFEDDGTKKRLG